MYESQIDLNKEICQKSIQCLDPALAAMTDLMLATKEAHWNVKGPTFIALHKLFDELNEEVEDYVDELAERIVQLGGHAHGTVAEVAKGTPLKAYPSGQRASEKHLMALSSHLAAVVAITRKGIDTSTEQGDTATADLFTELTRGLDKSLWFVESHLMS